MGILGIYGTFLAADSSYNTLVKKSILFAAFALLGLAIPSQAMLGLRDKVDSLWPDKPIVIDGRATEWSEFPVVEVGGLSFRARNDSSNLYLLIRGANDDGRILLSGNYRQNVGLWFLKPDEKTKAWGITLDFGRAHAPEPAMDGSPDHPRDMVTLSDMGIAPEMVMPQGLEVSTAAFPTDFAFQADLSSARGRQPIYEIQIPLSMIEHKGRTIFFDVVSSEVSPEAKAELQRQSSDHSGGENKSGASSPICFAQRRSRRPSSWDGWRGAAVAPRKRSMSPSLCLFISQPPSRKSPNH